MTNTTNILLGQTPRRAAEYPQWLEHKAVVTSEVHCVGRGTLANESRGPIIKKVKA
ncbi:hypothetical protein [Pseudomonas asplenii]|uniref:hypothetical protein n=1 Tax=Pseudomonas asplenii TaxID=53407 RepID=UPI000382C41F|nr:hypothetical protein [Pseudomonas fuscovaginae]